MKKKLFFKCLIILLILYLLYQCIITIYTIINPKMPCSVFGYKIFTVVYDTMEPSLNKGDWVVTTSVEKSKPQQGDIIAFKKGNEFLLHRIDSIHYKKTGELYETKGDNNQYSDNELLELSEIEGKYFFKISIIQRVILIMLIFIIFYIIKKRKVIIGIIKRRHTVNEKEQN